MKIPEKRYIRVVGDKKGRKSYFRKICTCPISLREIFLKFKKKKKKPTKKKKLPAVFGVFFRDNITLLLNNNDSPNRYNNLFYKEYKMVRRKQVP